MRVKVYGLRSDGMLSTRTVTLREFMEAWGPWALRVFHARRRHPVVVGDRAVWVEIVE